MKSSPESTAKVLTDFSLFSGLDAAERVAVRRLAVIKRYPRNTIIISQGGFANTLNLVVEGRIKIYGNDSDDDREIVFSEFGPGDYFGELALITAQPRVASAMAQSDCTLLTLSRASFLEIVEKYPSVAMQLMKDMALHIGKLTEDLSSLAFMDVYGRIAKLINEGVSEEDGRLMTPPWTHQAMASRVGSSREMVSKILRDLRAGGYLSVEGKRLVVENKLPPRW